MKKIVLLISVLLGINNAIAQEASAPFNLQVYQAKVQKFMETLTPQEKMMFIYTLSNSSGGNGLDSSTKDKIDKIYDILKGLESITCDSSYSGELKCEKRLGYY